MTRHNAPPRQPEFSGPVHEVSVHDSSEIRNVLEDAKSNLRALMKGTGKTRGVIRFKFADGSHEDHHIIWKEQEEEESQ